MGLKGIGKSDTSISGFLNITITRYLGIVLTCNFCFLFLQTTNLGMFILAMMSHLQF